MDLRRCVVAGYKLVTRFGKGLLHLAREFFLHQNVVGVVGGDCEDGHAIVREWLDERKKDSCLGEREWSFELEAYPSRAGGDFFRYVFYRADNGEFVGSAGNRGELTYCGPGGEGCVWNQTHNHVEVGHCEEFE